MLSQTLKLLCDEEVYIFCLDVLVQDKGLLKERRFHVSVSFVGCWPFKRLSLQAYLMGILTIEEQPKKLDK